MAPRKPHTQTAIVADIFFLRVERNAQLSDMTHHIRELCPSDCAQVRQLHEESFPIRYGESYFKRITERSNPLVCGWFNENTTLVGVVVARLVAPHELDPEDGPLLDLLWNPIDTIGCTR